MTLGRRFERTALGAGVVGLGLLAVGGAVSGFDQLFRSYLVGVIFWIGIAFGCLGLQMVHALSSGAWGVLARRPLHAASSTMPLLGVMFLPILGGLTRLYPWARHEVVEHDELIRHKSLFLNPAFFTARTVFYFVVWSGLALALYRRAVRRGTREGATRSTRVIAGPGILAAALTMTFAAIDWLMSLDPHWTSTMFGLLVIVGSMLSGMAFTIIALTSAPKVLVIEPQTITNIHAGAHLHEKPSLVPRNPLHDLGNLLMVFVMVWAYFSFSQYLIIYGGNMAEETPWYVHRTEGGWQHLALALIVLHFAVPFAVLVTRRTKRNPNALRAVAIGILCMRLVELFWFVMPNFYGHHLHVHWMDLVAPVGVGGVWLFAFSRRLAPFKAQSAVPARLAAGSAT